MRQLSSDNVSQLLYCTNRLNSAVSKAVKQLISLRVLIARLIFLIVH